MALLGLHCPNCQSQNGKTHIHYKVLAGEKRNIYTSDGQKFYKGSKKLLSQIPIKAVEDLVGNKKTLPTLQKRFR